MGSIGIAVALVPLFAAFEAHVINVTARIENALLVKTDPISFGTVFPQEHLERPLEVWLSDSFKTELRVDDVNYFIRQKPKCGVTTNDGKTLAGPTGTGHVIPNVATPAPDDYTIECGPAPRPLVQGETWAVLPSLCPYLSKHGDNAPDNDGDMPPFHQPFTVNVDEVLWNDTKGRLAKSEQDEHDRWIIDLAVPCFGGHCAQDWAKFVHDHNPDPAVNPDDYDQDIANEHKIFGCDLWVEVSDVSETPPPPPPPPTGDL